MYSTYVKRIFDLTLSIVGFIFLLPLFLFITIALFFVNSGKPFFFQARPGLKEKVFMVIKFKTMNDKRNKNGNLMPDGDRLTRVGNFVRKTSLDEIPQLLNVIKGDMSLVGPRPLLVEYLELYNVTQKKRHDVRPGITGWAQVNGRNTISWEDKFRLDGYYVRNIGFKFDMIILYKTISKVFISHGITAPGLATVNNFKGNDKKT